MCSTGLQSQCETTQVREKGKGASLFGYTSLYGSVPGGQAEYLRVPQAHYGPIKVSPDGPDERYLFLSDILPTAWQAVAYADVPEGGTLAVFGLGPGGPVLGPDRPPAGQPGDRHRADPRAPGDGASGTASRRLTRSQIDDLPAALQDLTDGRGPDSVIDAVGMEAHGTARRDGRQAGPGRGRRPARRHGAEADRDRGCRSADRAARRDRRGPPGRHRVDQRCVRRHRRPDADDGPVRQADPAADGSVQRQEVGGRHPAAGRRIRPTRSACWT